MVVVHLAVVALFVMIRNKKVMRHQEIRKMLAKMIVNKMKSEKKNDKEKLKKLKNDNVNVNVNVSVRNQIKITIVHSTLM